MRKVALLTPTYVKDFERFQLLCESLDHMTTGFERHYVLVNPDSDVERFARFASPKRLILRGSQRLPGWLWSAPRWFSRNGRRVWLSPFARPVHGWQQLLKISGTLAAEEDRVCIIDSDNLYFRPFDFTAYAGADLTPFYIDKRAIAADKPLHSVWARNAAKLLGQPEPSFPVDDYIGQMIVWDKATVKAMIERIEHANGVGWAVALCRTRQFSEYMIYGTFVANTPSLAAEHHPVAASPSLAHWDETELDERWIQTMMTDALPSQSALCIQSYSGTGLHLLRAALDRAKAA